MNKENRNYVDREGICLGMTCNITCRSEVVSLKRLSKYLLKSRVCRRKNILKISGQDLCRFITMKLRHVFSLKKPQLNVEHMSKQIGWYRVMKHLKFKSGGSRVRKVFSSSVRGKICSLKNSMFDI